MALARAFVMEPKVLLLDEPLSNLDAKLREQMRVELRRIQTQLGITSVYVTHDQVEAMALSDRIVVMNKGKIEQVGPPWEVYRQPANEFVANFIGRANFVDGEVAGVEGDRLVVKALGGLLDIPQPADERHVGEPVRLVVRPEAIKIDEPEGGFPAVVKRSSYLGELIEYDLEIGGQVLIATESDVVRAEVYPQGKKITIGFHKNAVYCLPKA